jgi:type II secretory pathway pseudopilin PulG
MLKNKNKKGEIMKLNFKKQSKGFTLIEILLVVGFIALASVGVYTIYNKVQISNNANAESRNIDLIRSGVKSLYASQTNYGAAAANLNTILNNARIVPEVMNGGQTGTANITNSFGGAVTVTVVGLNGGTNNAFRITYAQVPAAVCTKLAASAAAQFDAVTAGGSNVKTFGVNQIDVAALTAGCNTDAGAGVTMTFDSL